MVICRKKTGSLVDWQNALVKYSDSDELKIQIDYWDKIDNIEFDLSDKTKLQVSSGKERNKCQIVLDKEKTEFLLKDGNIVYKTDIQILLLILLSRTLGEGLDKYFLIFEIENHGRQLEDIDVSRTIGWFTNIYPIELDSNSKDIGSLIKSIKEKIRKVPENGIGYGISKYLNKSLKTFNNNISGLRFNYLG